jgi:hypothetical protein
METSYIKNKKSESGSIYDIDKYTDSELYDILDLNHPSDRELEAKILFMIHRYSNMQTTSGNELAIFFENIYRRFFDIEDSELHEKTEDEKEEEEEENIQTIEGMTGNDDPKPPQDNTETIVGVPKNPNLFTAGQASAPTTSVIGYTKSLDYTKDQLNPLLQQTIKRVISIDSQYRDDKKTMTTEFTFNLSDPLKDVVSLKLYSIQIPYTWYTISTSYGSNFFYLKGNSPGIDNGDYDYKIDISAGNYSPTELVTTLNNSIKKTASQITDVSFGTTGLSYNSNTSLITMSIDITKQYNETSYALQFPDVSFANYLGFANQTYRPYIINSYSFGNTYNPNASFSLNTANNYFTVYKYIGPNKFDLANSIIDLSFQITLSLTTALPHTSNEILNDLSNQLHACPYLDTTNSYIQSVSSAMTPTLIDVSYIQMALKPNRYTTNNKSYSKFAVVFPIESGLNKTIWTNANSCFQFQSRIIEINTIVSETTPIVSSGQTNYLITTSPYIYMHCIKPGMDSSLNDYRIDILNAGITGYTLYQYVAAINTGILNASNKYFNNGIYDIDTRYTTATIDNANVFNISFAINKYIHQTDFSANFTNSFVGLLPGISGLSNSYDLNTTNSITCQFLFSPTITIAQTNASVIRLIYKNVGSQPFYYNVTLSNTANNNYTLDALKTAINDAFTNYKDSGVNVLAGSTIAFVQSTDVNKDGIINTIVNATLTIVINKTLTQTDYSVQFFDISGNTFATGVNSSWYKNLKIEPSMVDSPIPLATFLTNTSKFSTIRGTSALPTPNTFTVNNTNNTLTVIPWEQGVAGNNAIQLTIPSATTYTPASLIAVINNAIQGTDLSGSLVEISTNTLGKENTSFRLFVNKVYSASDYRVVFYDPVSFVRCYVGVTSVKNTTWDTTVGWILGFRNYTVYDLSTYSAGSIVQIIGDTGISTNIFNYFLLCLDDYNQNHLNDGLVTITSTDTSIPLPSYAKKSNFICNPQGQLTYNTNELVDNNKLTQAQIYSITQIANVQNSTTSNLTKSVSTKSYGSGPFVKDVFGIIPMKVAGLANGSSYVEFGGTLQNQERSYFGPVNIHRMSVKLVSDRGDIVDLNGANWSFSLICEQLYKQKPGVTKESK